MISHNCLNTQYKNFNIFFMSKLNKLVVGTFFTTQILFARGNSSKMLQATSTSPFKNSKNKQTNIGKENKPNCWMDTLHFVSTSLSTISRRCHCRLKKSPPITNLCLEAYIRREHKRNFLYLRDISRDNLFHKDKPNIWILSSTAKNKSKKKIRRWGRLILMRTLNMTMGSFR